MIFSAGNIVAQQSIANTGIQSSVPIGKVQLTAALVQAGPHTLCIGRAAVAQIFIVHYSNIDTGHLIPGSSGLAETRIDIGQIVQLQIQLNNCIFRKGGNQIGHSGIKHIPPFLVGLCIAAAGSGAGEGIQHYTPLVGSVPTAGRRLRAEVDNLVGCRGSIDNGIKNQRQRNLRLTLQLDSQRVGAVKIFRQGDLDLRAGILLSASEIHGHIAQLQCFNLRICTVERQVQEILVPGCAKAQRPYRDIESIACILIAVDLDACSISSMQEGLTQIGILGRLSSTGLQLEDSGRNHAKDHDQGQDEGVHSLKSLHFFHLS